MYSAENQLVKALPKLVKGAKNPDLKSLFKAHLDETKGQVLRLKQVFQTLGEKPSGEHCNGMEGVIEEGSRYRGHGLHERPEISFTDTEA